MDNIRTYSYPSLLLALLSSALVLHATHRAHAVPVTDGMLLWLDASDASTLFTDAGFTLSAADGDPIGGWMDKSGNGFHATQADLALQPLRNDTAMNGLPAVRFSGTDGDGISIDDGLSLERPYTVFIVDQYYGDTRGRTLQGQDANWLHGLWSANVSSYADGFIGSNPAAEVNFAYVADTTGTPTGDSTLYVNGLDFTTDPAPTGQPGRLGLVGVGQFPAEVSDADISEVVIYNRVLSETELTDVRDFLYTKYDVTQLLPPAPPADTNTVLAGSLGTFTGGDPGEGLDLQGAFTYAINVGGPGDVTVVDTTFTDGSEAGMAGGSSPGATITDANEIPEWNEPAYGDSANDDAIETVMRSIRWNSPPGLEVDLQVAAGQPYKLQLLFAEQCCDRGFDIWIEDEMSVDNFNVQITQGGINNPAQGVVFTQEVTSADDVLSIVLRDPNPLAADNNAILTGVTLEAIPEPSTGLLALMGVALLGLIRRQGGRA